MQQLSGLDTTFLNIETPTTYGHVSGLALFDPSSAPRRLGFEEIKDKIRERLHLLAPYRRRLVEVPFGLDHPYWIEDPHFDLDFHVRQVGLPAPGNRRQLIELVERIVSRPLDRGRPLWELYFIEGLENGYVAQLTKHHHAAIDGETGAEVLAATLDLEPEPQPVPPPEHEWQPDRVPTELEMFQRGLAVFQTRPALSFKLWAEWMESLPDLLEAAGFTAPPTPWYGAVVQPDEEAAIPRPPTPPPRTSFNAPIGPHRTFDFTSISLADIKAIKDSFGVTVNDVVLALCAAALRQYLGDRDELPETSLIAMVPVSVRAEGRRGNFGNQVTSVTTPLFTQVADPAERLGRIHEAMLAAKETQRAMPAELQRDLADYSPPAVAALLARTQARAAAERLVDLPYNLVISNVAGPQFPLYGAGSRLVASYPISTITDGEGLNITVQSYDGNVDFGAVGCRDLVPDIGDIVAHLPTALAELRQAAAEPSDPKTPEKTPEKPKKKSAAEKKSAAKNSKKKKKKA